MIGGLRDAVCDEHHTRGGDEKLKFSSLALKLVAMDCQWFGLKTIVTVSWFGPENQGQQFRDLGLKNHRNSFLVWVSKPGGRRFVGLCLKTNERMKTV
jgi:hypothetical protein